MRVQSTVNETNGTAVMTVSEGADDHKFEVWVEGSDALVEYQETLSWRAFVQVSEPSDRIFKILTRSDEMTDFLDAHGASSVKRA
jgi:hypothetical protein